MRGESPSHGEAETNRVLVFFPSSPFFLVLPFSFRFSCVQLVCFHFLSVFTCFPPYTRPDAQHPNGHPITPLPPRRHSVYVFGVLIDSYCLLFLGMSTP